MQVSCMVPWYTNHTRLMQGNANILNHAGADTGGGLRGLQPPPPQP